VRFEHKLRFRFVVIEVSQGSTSAGVAPLPYLLNVFNFKILFREVTLLFTRLSLQQETRIKNKQKMEKEMIFAARNQSASSMQRSVNNVLMAVGKALNGAKVPVEWLRKYYSAVCEKELTFSQTLLLINAQLAFIAAAFPVSMPVVGRIACCVWLVFSLKKCEKEI